MKIKKFYKFGKKILEKTKKKHYGGGVVIFLLKKINKWYRVNV